MALSAIASMSRENRANVPHKATGVTLVSIQYA